MLDDQPLNPLQMLSSEIFTSPPLINWCDQIIAKCLDHCGNFMGSAKKCQVSFATALLLD